MPSKPKKPCAYPGCPALVAGRYCEEHARKVNSDYEKFSRDKQTKHRYGRAWKRIRDKYASEHPFCELCFGRGLAVPVEEIHHKKPLSEGGTHDRSNLIALCKSCHYKFMRSVEIVGMTGRGGANLYRPISYRTAGGCCVCSREMEDGGSSLKIH